MSEPKKSLLVIKTSAVLSNDQRKAIIDSTQHVADDLSCNVIVEDGSLDAEMHWDLSPLLSAIGEQTQAMRSLAQSNMALVEALVDAMADDEAGNQLQAQYLDGSPCQ